MMAINQRCNNHPKLSNVLNKNASKTFYSEVNSGLCSMLRSMIVSQGVCAITFCDHHLFFFLDSNDLVHEVVNNSFQPFFCLFCLRFLADCSSCHSASFWTNLAVQTSLTFGVQQEDKFVDQIQPIGH